eukprot:5007632-Amphidinium_carterae.1
MAEEGSWERVEEGGRFGRATAQKYVNAWAYRGYARRIYWADFEDIGYSTRSTMNTSTVASVTNE